MQVNESAYIIFVPPSFSKFIIAYIQTIVKYLSKVFLKRKLPYLKKVLAMLRYVWYNRYRARTDRRLKKKVERKQESPCNDVRCMI